MKMKLKMELNVYCEVFKNGENYHCFRKSRRIK